MRCAVRPMSAQLMASLVASHRVAGARHDSDDAEQCLGLLPALSLEGG